MAVQTITYGNKNYLNQNADIPATNKVQDTDMNEIKSVVNNNATETSNNTTNIGNLSNLATENKTSIVNSINELKNAEIYSTEEVKTNKIWINGKPIYRKVITGTKSSGWTDISLSNINYDTIYINGAETYFTYINSSTKFSKNTFYFSPTDFLVAQIQTDNKKINIGAGTDLSNINYYIVLEYTKTTD